MAAAAAAALEVRDDQSPKAEGLSEETFGGVGLST